VGIITSAPAPPRDTAARVPYTAAMPLTCNIDAKGKRARFIFGLIRVAAAALGFFWARGAGDWRRWTAAGVMFLAGSFALFEARAGWCAMRAMGFKTKF
jgi:hypothetical protein